MTLALPTSAQLLEDFRRAFEAAAAPALAPGARFGWGTFSRLNLVRTACVRIAERVLFLLDDRFHAAFLDTAAGDDLDAWADSEAPGFPRNPASAATLTLVLSRPTTGAGAGTIAAGSRFSTVATPAVPAVTFKSTADVFVGATALTANVPLQAEATGPAGNVEANTVTRLLTSLYDGTLVASTSPPAAGGTDAEADDAFRDRLRQRDARYRRGTIQALVLGAQTVPGVTQVAVIEPVVRDPLALLPPGTPAPGFVVVVVADASGLGSDAMALAVRAALEDWRAAGIYVSVYPASTAPYLGAGMLTVAVTTTSAPGVDAAAIERDARTALRAFFRGLKAGQRVHPAQLVRVVANVALPVRNVTVTAVEGDGDPLALVPGQRWDLTDDRIAFTPFATEAV